MNTRPLIAACLFASACGNPLAPRGAMQRSSYAPDQLGRVDVTNTTDTAGVFTFVVWDANDLTNQIDRARTSATIAPHQTVTLTVGLSVDPCVRYQRDVYLNLPTAGPYTLSDVGNYFYDAPGVLWGPTQTCRTTTTTTIPVVRRCVPEAFSAVSTNHAGGIETATITVPSGLGGFVAYLISWGVPEPFAFGLVPLPQTRVYLTTQTLHDGVNVMTVTLADAQTWPAWQIEGGCEPGPEILTSAQDRAHGGQFDWVFDDGGNF